MASIVTCFAVAVLLAAYARWKGRTAWHWFVFSLCVFAITWVATVAVLDFSGVRVWLPSHKLALFAGVLTGATIMIVLVSVPDRPGRALWQARRGSAR